MRANPSHAAPWLTLALAALAGVSSCAAGAPEPPALPVSTQAVDADRDGHPEDLRVQVTLARVPAGRWSAFVSLASTARPIAAGASGDLAAHASPASEHRSLEQPLVLASNGREPCVLTCWFRGDDVAALRPGAPHPLRVLLRSASATPGASATLRQYDGVVRVANPAAFLQTPARVLAGALDAAGAAVRVDLLTARAEPLIVQASVVAGVTAVRTGRATTNGAGRRSVRVPMAVTPDAAGVAKTEPRRLVIEVIRPADAMVIATWDTALDGAR